MKEISLAPDPIQITKGATYLCTGAACVLSVINQNAAAIGVCLAILTYATNVFFQWRRDKRERNTWDGNERRRGPRT